MRRAIDAAARLLALAGLAACLLPVWPADPANAKRPEIDSAVMIQSERTVVLDLSSSAPLRYEIATAKEPDRIVLDLLGCEAPIEPRGADDTACPLLRDVRSEVLDEGPAGRTVRYVLETTEPMSHRVDATGSRLRLWLQAAGPADAERPGTEPGAPRPSSISPSLAGTQGTLAAAMLTNPPSQLDPAGGGQPISLDVQGADVKTVLRSIAEFGGVNIVPDIDVGGPLSVRITEIPWRRALDVVCNSAGLEAVENGGVLRVATRKALVDEDLDRESAARKKEELVPLATEIFPVRYANAEELKNSILFVLSKRGSAEVDPRTNSVLVSDIQDRIDAVKNLVRELDTETLQVEIIAKLVDLDITAARQMGVVWDLNNLHSSGEKLSGSIGQNTSIASVANDIKFGMVRDWGDFNATIQLMERENKANIISNPSITTVNNRQARILVGKEIPLIVLDEAGNPITELKKVGITLEVTAHINSENQVTLDLHPEVSDLSSQSTVQGGIVFTTAEADTRVMVNNGETAVIGGLIRTNETKFEEGVPVLRSIPILGNLFKSTDTRDDRRELMIFVTPRIVRGLASLETK